MNAVVLATDSTCFAGEAFLRFINPVQIERNTLEQ